MDQHDDVLADVDERLVRRKSGALTIGRVARRYGLSRATLLFYDRIGLLSPESRTDSGYRLYGPDAEQRLARIVELRRAGVPLKEIGCLLDGERAADTVLGSQLQRIDRDMRSSRDQRRAAIDLLGGAEEAPRNLTKADWTAMFKAAGMTIRDMWKWHAAFEQRQPDAHAAFLTSLGIAEPEADAIRRKSRDIGPVATG